MLTLAALSLVLASEHGERCVEEGDWQFFMLCSRPTRHCADSQTCGTFMKHKSERLPPFLKKTLIDLLYGNVVMFF